MKRTTIAAIVVAAACAVAPAPPATAVTSAPDRPQTSNCFWFGPTFTVSDPALNYAFPDTGAGYWAARFTMPAGAKLVLKGACHPDDGHLIMRNKLPPDGFQHAVQKTSVPGDEQSVMGDYLPTGKYLTVAQFEQHGPCGRRSCNRLADRDFGR